MNTSTSASSTTTYVNTLANVESANSFVLSIWLKDVTKAQNYLNTGFVRGPPATFDIQQWMDVTGGKGIPVKGDKATMTFLRSRKLTYNIGSNHNMTRPVLKSVTVEPLDELKEGEDPPIADDLGLREFLKKYLIKPMKASDDGESVTMDVDVSDIIAT